MARGIIFQFLIIPLVFPRFLQRQKYRSIAGAVKWATTFSVRIHIRYRMQRRQRKITGR